MKKNTNLHKKTLDLYVDEYGKQYIGVPKKNIAYVLAAKDENKYNVFAGRYLLSFAICVLIMLQIDWKLGLGVGFITLLVSEACYRKMFLSKLPIITNVEFGKKLESFDDLKQQPRMKNIIVLIALVVLIVLLFLNLYLSIPNLEELKKTNNIIMVIGTGFLVLYALYYGYRIIKALVK